MDNTKPLEVIVENLRAELEKNPDDARLRIAINALNTAIDALRWHAEGK